MNESAMCPSYTAVRVLTWTLVMGWNLRRKGIPPGGRSFLLGVLVCLLVLAGVVTVTPAAADDLIWAPGQSGGGSMPFAEPKADDPLARAYREGQEVLRKRRAFEDAIRTGRFDEVIGYEFKDCPDCPEMVVVPASSFDMGSNDGDKDEKPVHRVTISRPFAVGKFEVTRDEWRAVMGPIAGTQSGRHPIGNVDWNDVQAFVRGLSRKAGGRYRLLTEGEWEYAARAGSTMRYPWGDEIDPSMANYTNGRAQPVGSYKPNAFGLYDTAGNMWEWVEDTYHDSYKDVPNDGGAWVSNRYSGRVLRSGSWITYPPKSPHGARSASRAWGEVSQRKFNIGVRVARDL